MHASMVHLWRRECSYSATEEQACRLDNTCAVSGNQYGECYVVPVLFLDNNILGIFLRFLSALLVSAHQKKPTTIVRRLACSKFCLQCSCSFSPSLDSVQRWATCLPKAKPMYVAYILSWRPDWKILEDTTTEETSMA